MEYLTKLLKVSCFSQSDEMWNFLTDSKVCGYYWHGGGGLGVGVVNVTVIGPQSIVGVPEDALDQSQQLDRTPRG